MLCYEACYAFVVLQFWVLDFDEQGVDHLLELMIGDGLPVEDSQELHKPLLKLRICLNLLKPDRLDLC
jgi:hypothetical protein